MAFEWRNHLDDKYIYHIQQSCEKSMSLLGYKTINNVTSNKLDDNISLLEENISIQSISFHLPRAYL